MSNLRIWTRTKIGTNEVEQELECDTEHWPQEERIRVIKIVLELEENKE